MNKTISYLFKIIIVLLILLALVSGYLATYYTESEILLRDVFFQDDFDMYFQLHVLMGQLLAVSVLILFTMYFFINRKKELWSFLLYLLNAVAVGLLFYSGRGLEDTILADRDFKQFHFVGVILLCLSIAGSFVYSIVNREQRFLDVICPAAVKGWVYIFLLAGIGIVLGLYVKGSGDETVTLTIEKASEKITIDGREVYREWETRDSLVLSFFGGANFRQGKTTAVLKASYDNQFVYFKLVWNDPTRSQNRFIVKGNGSWKELQTEPKEPSGENRFFEDQATFFLSAQPVTCFASCHADATSKIKYHAAEDSLVDVWFWKAVSSNPIAFADDGWLGLQTDSIYPGVQYDNRAGGGAHLNLNNEWMQPYFLQLVQYNQSWIDLKYNNAVPYFMESDSLPEGSKLPAIIISSMSGDRADVRAIARWNKGRWVLEVSRKQKTGSPHDVSLFEDFYLSIALFDNSEQSHAVNSNVIHITRQQ